jgi:hypothetical protein
MPGTLTHSPADIIAQLLVDIGYGIDPTANGAWPIFTDVEPDLPDNCITCGDTSGQLQGRFMFDGKVQGMDGVQVRVRGATQPIAFVKANAIAEALSAVYQKIVHLGGSNYEVHSISRTSFVESRGKDAPSSKRSLFFINCLVHVETD